MQIQAVFHHVSCALFNYQKCRLTQGPSPAVEWKYKYIARSKLDKILQLYNIVSSNFHSLPLPLPILLKARQRRLKARHSIHIVNRGKANLLKMKQRNQQIFVTAVKAINMKIFHIECIFYWCKINGLEFHYFAATIRNAAFSKWLIFLPSFYPRLELILHLLISFWFQLLFHRQTRRVVEMSQNGSFNSFLFQVCNFVSQIGSASNSSLLKFMPLWRNWIGKPVVWRSTLEQTHWWISHSMSDCSDLSLPFPAITPVDFETNS